MWEKINNFLKGQIVTSIIYIALGACLVFMPVSTVNVICKFVFGILLILVGLYHILIYVAEKLNSTIFDLFSGGVLMVLGIFLFMNPQIVVKLLPANIVEPNTRTTTFLFEYPSPFLPPSVLNNSSHLTQPGVCRGD